MPPGGFRAAYTTQGVSSYYTNHGGTYRNPHFPGVVKCIHAILSKLLLTVQISSATRTGNQRGLVTNNPNDVLFEIDTGERCELPFMAELQMLNDKHVHDEGMSKEEEEEGGGRQGDGGGVEGLTVFDLAAGGGEATAAVKSWVDGLLPSLTFQEADQDGYTDRGDGSTQRGTKESKRIWRKGKLKVYASDPFTSGLYEEQVNGLQRDESTFGEDEAGEQGGGGGGEHEVHEVHEVESRSEGKRAAEAPPLHPPPPHSQKQNSPSPSPPFIRCYSFSFRDISLHGLDTLLLVSPLTTTTTTTTTLYAQPLHIDMTIISFALHLCPTSELFSLLYEISRHSAYLVVVAPHKNPHIPGAGEWGWIGPVVEVLVRRERVRGRVFRSVNF